MPKWRNGRRGGLKHRWPQGRVGSTPTFGTTDCIRHGLAADVSRTFCASGIGSRAVGSTTAYRSSGPSVGRVRLVKERISRTATFSSDAWVSCGDKVEKTSDGVEFQDA
jgi:hypothetical protein